MTVASDARGGDGLETLPGEEPVEECERESALPRGGEWETVEIVVHENKQTHLTFCFNPEL